MWRSCVLWAVFLVGCHGKNGSPGNPDLLSLPTLNIANAIVTPADPSKIVYPDAYQAKPSAATIEDPYCGISRDPAIFPADYLGAFPLPPLRGAPLPAGIQLSMQMKDYWKAGLKNVALNQACPNSGSIHTAFPISLLRLKELGATRVGVTTFDGLFDATAATPMFDLGNEQIPPAELTFIGNAAATAGIDTLLYMQISGGDEKGVTLPVGPTVSWFSALLDGYNTRVMTEAAAAQAAHIGAMTLNWIEYCADLNLHPELVDTLVSKLTASLGQVRAAYSGKVLLFDHPCVIPADLTKLAPLISSLDGVIVSLPNQILTSTEDQAPTVDLLVGKYGAFLDSMQTRWGASGKPLTISTQMQSHRQYLETGWIEDSPYPCDPDCPEKHLTIDFSVQAMAYEALLETVKAKQAAGMNITFVEPSGYWETDELVPQPNPSWVFPNMAHTIRNKPAEAIVYRWFKR